MGLFDTLSVGRRALGAAQAGIDVTAQNVANAGTVGYSRRRLLTQNSDPIRRQGVWVGQGVDISGVTRATDLLLGARVVSVTGQHAQAESLESTLSVTEAYFDETGSTSIAEAHAAFYDALSSLTTDPADVALRREAITTASALADAVSRIGQGLQASIESIDGQLNEQTDTINNTLAEIASLNGAIGRSGASLGAGDLLDRRDQLVLDLGERIGATVEYRQDGQATVFIGGHAAVSLNEARTISVAEDGAGEAQVYLSAGSGLLRVTDGVGGQMGGALTGRTQVQSWLSDLDDFAASFADAINTQHAVGFDSAGTAGGALFTYAVGAESASLAVDDALLGDANLLALAGAATAMPGDDTNLRALLDIEDAELYGGGTRTGAEEISALVSSVGSAVSAASSDTEALASQLGDLSSMRDSISQVDTDEEAIRLIEYQAQYRAAARVISVSDEMVQTLLAIGS